MRVAIDFDGGDRFLEQALAEAGDDEVTQGSDPRATGLAGVTYRGRTGEGGAARSSGAGHRHAAGDQVLEMLAASTAATAASCSGGHART